MFDPFFYVGTALMAQESARAKKQAREAEYLKYFNEATKLGVTPKTRHEFNLELDNAESLRLLAAKEPTVNVNVGLFR